MKKHFVTACLYTAITAVVLGIVYPLAITALAHLLFPAQASGSLITRNGVVLGSRLIGQTFDGPLYFHSRPSAAGGGYDAAASSGSNLGPSSKALADRVAASVKDESASGSGPSTFPSPIPIDLVTTSASGLDPDITPASAMYQAQRVAAARRLPVTSVYRVISANLTPRQFGLLGEPRVNVLLLNLALDRVSAPDQPVREGPIGR